MLSGRAGECPPCPTDDDMKQTILRYELPLALAALAAVAVWLALAVTAQAHANLARATPEPGSVVQTAPARVTGWFTETMEPAFSKMQVLDSSGARVDLDDSGVDASDATSMSVGLPDGLPNGTYAVVWNNLSTVDGHTLRGAFVFHIGEPSGGAAVELDSEPPLLQSQADPFVRWLVLLGAFAAIGGAGFYLLVAGPVLTGKRAEPAFRETGRMLARRSAQLGAGGVALLLAASIGQLVLQAIKLDSGVGTVIGGTEWGALWASRVGLGVAMGVALVVLARGRPSRRAGTPTMATVAALALGVGLLLTVSLASHAAALREARSAAIFSDFLHLAATALWVGGLMHLALSGLLLLRHVPESMRTAMLARVVPRFSVLAVLCVGTLVVTGIFAAWAQVSSPGAVATPYGWTLVAKTALVAPLFALGAANLLFTTPRLAKGRDGDAWLRRLVAGEVALAVLALLAVGYLTSMEPARQTAARAAQEAGTRYEETAQGTRVSAEVSPGRVGVNTLEVTLRDVLDRPITNASPVRARITYLDQDLGSEFQDLTNAG
ncbi:MAG: hypothetical protein FJ317_01615, partial [SAR202 cluster bacterium]|nr:hypothetical protein [SAR202 cluster bacterium]